MTDKSIPSNDVKSVRWSYSGRSARLQTFDSLLTNGSGIPGMLSLNGEKVGVVNLIEQESGNNRQAFVLRDVDPYGVDIYKIVNNGEVIGAFTAAIFKKDSTGQYQEGRNGLHGQPSDWAVNYGVGDTVIKQAEYIRVDHVYVSENVRYENLGKALIQTMVEASIKEGCEGRVKVEASYQSPCAFFHYDFRSMHYRESRQQDVLIFDHLDGFIRTGISINTQDPLGTVIMHLPNKSIPEWKTMIEQNPILALAS